MIVVYIDMSTWRVSDFNLNFFTRRKDGNTVVVTMTLQITSDKKVLNHFIIVFDPTWNRLM